MINTLGMALKKRGSWFLNERVTITEKLDTFRILFEKQGEEFKFYKKDNTEINLVERTLSDLWEQAILELPMVIGDTKIPEGVRFGLAYTPTSRPNRIPYTDLPIYILTDMTKREDDKVTHVYEYDEIEEWAKILNLARPPVLFNGILTEEQSNKLISYDSGDFENINSSFAGLIEEELGCTYSNEPMIEGIIIKDYKDQISQIISYEFNLLNEAYNKEVSRDFYDLVILSLNKFMEGYSIPIMEAENPDQTYVDIICDMFNNYLDRNPITESFSSDLLTPPGYGYQGSLNTKFIKNEKTLELLEENKAHESLFKVMISSFRKHKKEYGLLTEHDVTKFNAFVGIINDALGDNNDLIEDDEDHILNEAARSDNVVVDALLDKKSSDIDNMRVIASIQKAFGASKLKTSKGTQQCVIYVTDFTPFTKVQMDNVNSIFRTWKVPVILASISNKRRIKGDNFCFSDELVKAQMDSLKVFNKDIIANTFMINDWNIVECFEYVRPDYEPIALITDIGKKAEFVIQLFFEEEVMGGRIGVEKNFNIGEMEISDKLKANRSLEDELFYTFKDYTTNATWNLYNSMLSELKKHNSQIMYIEPNAS